MQRGDPPEHRLVGRAGEEPRQRFADLALPGQPHEPLLQKLEQDRPVIDIGAPGELDLQATQQTNQNLYFLSVLTALLMPATLVTGIFGMNTGGLIWLSAKYGSLYATGLAIASSLLVYLVLRLSGFIRR